MSKKPIRSWSQYSTYMKCPQLFFYQYIERSVPRTDSIPLYAGTTVLHGHEEMCKKKIKGEDFTFEEILKLINTFWEKKSETFSSKLTEFFLEKRKLKGYMEAYYHYFINNDITPLFTEKDLMWEPEGYNFAIRGIIDRIDTDNSLVDLKTSKKSPPFNKAKGSFYLDKKTGYDLQLDIYVMLMRNVLNIEPSKAKLEFIVKTKTPKVVPIEMDISEEKLSSTLDLLANLEESIQKGIFPKNRLSTYCGEKWCAKWEECTGLKKIEV